LRHNPGASFLIGHAWTARGPSLDTETFDRRIRESGERLYQFVAKLRRSYPNNRIHFINYGVTASAMKARFENGDLEDIEALVGRNREALFADGVMGHGGPMMHDVSALSWLGILYGADVEDLSFGPYSPSDVQGIVGQVIAYDQKFNRDY
jgi:hypothetical protein